MSELLEAWVDEVPVGRALDLGAGDGETACWLASRGFTVDAIERDRAVFERLKRTCDGTTVQPHLINLMTFPMPVEKYTLIIAQAVLHFLRPTELWPLADRMCHALVPGGWLLAEVFTTDDPGYTALHASDVVEIEPNTFRVDHSIGVIHYFAPQELVRVFASLEVLAYDETRFIDSKSQDDYRAGAALMARKRCDENG